MTARVLRAPQTEAEFQAQVVELAHLLGWHHLHVRRSIGKGRQWVTTANVIGWPDLLLWHETQQRVIAVELKSAKGVVSDDQTEVLRQLAAAGLETHLWRPADLDQIARTLSGRNP